MLERIETNRLLLKPVHTVPVERLFSLFNVEDRTVFSLCGWSKHDSIKDTEEFVQKAESEWKKDDRYRYAIRMENEGLVGTTYIDVSTHANSGVLGLWIDKPYWGRGISGERADSIIKMGFEELGLTHIRVGCLSENNKSRRAIEKYIRRHGGVFYGIPPVSADNYSSYPQETRPHIEYAIRRKDYYQNSKGIKCAIPGFGYEDIDFSRLEP